MQRSREAQKLWGGRFEGEADPLFRAFNDSLAVDCVLVQYDIRGSIAWAGAIRDAGVITAGEHDRIIEALEAIANDVEARPGLIREARDEDVHSFVERELIERIGDAGKKLHTGRSRNDQVATDLRLYCRDAVAARAEELRELERTLVELAERSQTAILPGYTHLQRGQPILFAHWCLAYIEMLERDRRRFASALERINICPLGSAALAGTSFPVDRDALATALGFDCPSANSLDAVSDRDFVLEMLFCAVTVALHLSRMAEDLIIYSSAEFGFIEMSDAVTSGSSLMPQKKNPDAMELIRGKCGGMLGAFTAMAVTIKGTPLAYNKDFQEDKQPLFSAMQELSMCLRMAARALRDITISTDAMHTAARGGYGNATAFAYYLVKKGMAFREAHEVTGRIVRLAIDRSEKLEDLDLETLQRSCPAIDSDVFDAIRIEGAIADCDVYGGTSPARVAAAIKDARARLDEPMP